MLALLVINWLIWNQDKPLRTSWSMEVGLARNFLPDVNKDMLQDWQQNWYMEGTSLQLLYSHGLLTGRRKNKLF
jgi:hypothetical protein